MKKTGRTPHPKMQQEFMTEPTNAQGKIEFNKLATKKGLK